MSQTAVLTAGANTATNSVSGNAVNYYGPWEGVLFLASGNTTEANAQAVNRGAATLQNAYVQVPTNSRTTTTTVTSRVNGAAGNISITIGAGLTGAFSDSTHSDSLADGDQHNYKVAMGASAEALNISGISAQLVSSGQCFRQQLGFPSASFSFQAAAGYILPAGATTSNATESNRQMVALESATLSNLQVYVSTSGSSSPTVKARVNGATVNQTVTLTASTTGIFEDSTHSDSIVSGDLFNMITNGGNVTRTISFLGFKYLGSTTNQSPVYGGGITVASSAATNYWAFGHNSKSTTEADTKFPMPSAGTASGLYVRLTNNTVGTNQNWQFRLNGASVNQVAVMTASTTGTFADSTHSDTIAAGDLVNVTTASTFNANATVSNYGFLFVASAGGTNVALTGQAGTGAIGTFAPSLTVGLTGAASTGSAGSLGTGIGITGVSATGAAGSLGVAADLALVGQSATGAAGSLGPQFTIALTGTSATGAIGTITPLSGVTIGLTGVSATGSIGTFTPAMSISLTGVAGAGSAGILGIGIALTGVSATGAKGALGVSAAVGLSGVSATGAIGSLAAALSIALTGKSATGSTGSLGVSFALPLTGKAATGFTGTLSASFIAAAPPYVIAAVLRTLKR